jgi:hypothetical protein
MTTTSYERLAIVVISLGVIVALFVTCILFLCCKLLYKMVSLLLLLIQKHEYTDVLTRRIIMHDTLFLVHKTSIDDHVLVIKRLILFFQKTPRITYSLVKHALCGNL